ncbi:unnamed protein product [Lupinus luteus]|uniref:NB-ARC domain-containing protein n=1 Tax=Lupinus luteus TaxID=3873 RepID=A0AAV1YML0_LUPLU
MAMDTVKSIVSPIVEYTTGLAWSNIKYIIFYETNLDKLNTQLQNLVAVRDSLQQRVDAAQKNGEEILIDVQNNLNKANVSIGDANNFLNDEDHARVGCLNSPLTNLCRKQQLSQKSIDKANTISEIITQVKHALNMDNISTPPSLRVAFPPSTRCYEALQSRTSILNEIMQELKDDNMYMIGVYGMGGVGKTTLVEEVAWQAENDDSYGVVIKATVSNSTDVEGIQGQLADGLGLKFNEETRQGRAQRLWNRITKEDKVLVIMDDLWGEIDLKEVGVPFGDQHKGCKLLLTSRDVSLLSKKMGTQRDFQISTLSTEEGWDLFEKATGDVVKEFCIQTKAREVAGACKGLPVLLVAVAKALKKEKRLYAWNDAFNKLNTHDDEGFHSRTDKAIEFSYNYLASEQHKSIFLLIASAGKGSYKIEDLFVQVWGLGLFKKVDKLGDAWDKLHTIIDDLKASSLILDGDGDEEYVTMHDVIFHGAAKIACREEPFFSLKEGSELIEWPEMDELRKFKKIILPRCYISSLPECLDCPKLELLLLHSQENTLKMGDGFFSLMTGLKYLKLKGFMCTPSLLLSLSFLKKLKVLFLHKCVLGDITLVSKLKGLEILSLDDTGIQVLPKEIGQLTHLRKLDFDNCISLRLIPANIISSLTRLEELHLWQCHIEWEVEESKHCSNASLCELGKLDHLTSLKLQIQHISNIPKDLLIFANLKKYKILIGGGWKPKWDYYSKISRVLMLNLSSTTISSLNVGIKMLLNGVEELSLAEMNDVRNVLPELNGQGFPQLKRLVVKNCVEILYIIEEEFEDNAQINFSQLCSIRLEKLPNLVTFSSKKSATDIQSGSNIITDSGNLSYPMALFDEKIVMPNLESMELISINVEKLYDISVPPFFENLTELIVERCDKLKYLFSYSVVKTLVKLKNLQIWDCEMVEHIFVEDEEEYVCKERSEMNPILQNIDRVQIYGCPMLKNIFPSSRIFQSLDWLTVMDCSRIVNIMTSSTARSLVNLRNLSIRDCEMVEEIVACENDSDGGEIAFMKLQCLDLEKLPRLRRFCNQNLSFKFPLLERLRVIGCPEIEPFSPTILLGASNLTQVYTEW